MPNSNRKLLALGLAGVLATTGVATVVNAQQNAQSRPKSSIQVPEGSEQEGQEGKEERSLQPLARISAQQAATIAEQQYGGKATGVELDNEDGNLVYSVEIGDQEVKVDAGDGKVLYADKEAEGSEDGEG